MGKYHIHTSEWKKCKPSFTLFLQIFVRVFQSFEKTKQKQHHHQQQQQQKNNTEKDYLIVPVLMLSRFTILSKLVDAFHFLFIYLFCMLLIVSYEVYEGMFPVCCC